jgi:hypothetical protein
MASHLYRDMADVELASGELGLTERRFAMIRQGVLLLLTVALGVTAMICALRGYAWPLPTGTGASTALTGIAAGFDRRLAAQPTQQQPLRTEDSMPR